MNAKVKRFIVFNAKALSLLGLWLLSGIYPSINVTDSLRHRLFVTSPIKSSIGQGDYVQFKAHVPGVAGKRVLIKQVVGLPGDIIVQKDNQCWVNDIYIGKVHTISLGGHPLSGTTAKKVSDNTVFVKGDSPRSYDSRYEGLGLIQLDEVKKVYAVF